MSTTEEATANKGKGPKKPAPALSREQVVKYLKAHPDFLIENPDLVEILKSPKAERGEGVVDLQHYMVGGLQKELKSVRGKYDEIVDYCRDNMSTQSQVHHAIVNIVKARDLEQLLQVITVDLMNVFGVDVVRLAMETEGAEMYEVSYPDANFCGITFIETGTVYDAMGEDGDILLCEDSTKAAIPSFEEIFADCHGIVRSCAMLRLHLESVHKDVILAFGVREAGRFHAHQGVDLLSFLAQIVEYRLDQCLSEMDPDSLT